MTVETCEQQMERFKGDPEMLAFWKDRRDRRIAKYPKYLHLRKEVKDEDAHLRPKPEPKEKPKHGKKSKR